MEKRGLSMIVTSLIIILLAIVAIGVLYVVYINFVRTGAEGISLGKFTIDLEIENAYVEGDNVKVSVKRNPGKGDLVAINFIISDGNNSEISREETTLQELGGKSFTIVLSELNIEDVEIVSIAPIYKSDSGEEIIGDILDTYKISREGGGNGGGNGNGGTGEPDTGYCGDSIIQIPNEGGGLEVCDGINLGGESCFSQGFDEGILACNVDCLSFDFSSCTGGGGTPPIPISCNGSWNPPEDQGVECDGGVNCDFDCTCRIGFTADGSGGCNLNPSINNGIIYSVWPSGAVKYFDSEDLPIDVSRYTQYYVNFSGSDENGCFRITWAEYMESNFRSYIRTEFIINVSAGEGYYVWEAENCGQ